MHARNRCVKSESVKTTVCRIFSCRLAQGRSGQLFKKIVWDDPDSARNASYVVAGR
jgi:hypothetical protein